MKINIINLGKKEYNEALSIQEKLLIARQNDKIENTLILVEHPPTLTLGIGGKSSNILASSEILKGKNINIYEINRGGDVTYHGDGQIVGYLIFSLADFPYDIKKFIWNIEEVFIKLLDEQFNIKAQREDKKYTGVWIGDEKITAIGIAVKRGVTMHGFAFNVNTNLENFKLINPCGLIDKGVTSLEKLTGVQQDFEMLNKKVIDYFCDVFEVQGEVKEIKDLGI
jgi:lipoyl(octanoyl) transferase